jgi:hypothetical protein
MIDPPPGRATIRQIAIDEGELWALCTDGSVWSVGYLADSPTWQPVVRPWRGGPDPVEPDDPTPPRPSLGALQDALRADRTEAARQELDRQIEELKRRLASG